MTEQKPAAHTHEEIARLRLTAEKRGRLSISQLSAAAAMLRSLLEQDEMRIDPDECRDPELLAAEVQRLNAVIAAGEPALTDDEREAIEFFAAIHNEGYGLFATHTDTLRNLLERLT